MDQGVQGFLPKMVRGFIRVGHQGVEAAKAFHKVASPIVRSSASHLEADGRRPHRAECLRRLDGRRRDDHQRAGPGGGRNRWDGDGGAGKGGDEGRSVHVVQGLVRGQPDGRRDLHPGLLRELRRPGRPTVSSGPFSLRRPSPGPRTVPETATAFP